MYSSRGIIVVGGGCGRVSGGCGWEACAMHAHYVSTKSQ